MLYVRSTSNNLVPLETLATITNNIGPMSISHFGQLPSSPSFRKKLPS